MTNPTPPRRPGAAANLSPAETVLLDFIRDPAPSELVISIARTGSGVVVTLAITGEGVSVGAGPTFESALFRVCGRELHPDSLLGDTPTDAQH